MTPEHRSSPADQPADSAGVPWQGRSFDQHSDAFVNDVGDTPIALAAALRAFRNGNGSYASIVEEFARARLLIPLITVAGEEGLTPEGRRVDKTQELSIVTVQAPDGRAALPVFSSVAAMQRWNAQARPVPNFGQTVARAAVEEGSDLVILNPGSPETECALRRPALWAVAQGLPYSVPWSDPDVVAAFHESVAAHREIELVSLESADPTARLLAPELLVGLTIRPGLSQQQLTGLLAQLQAVWAQSAVIAERVDSMSVKLRSGSTAAS